MICTHDFIQDNNDRSCQVTGSVVIQTIDEHQDWVPRIILFLPVIKCIRENSPDPFEMIMAEQILATNAKVHWICECMVGMILVLLKESLATFAHRTGRNDNANKLPPLMLQHCFHSPLWL